MNWIIEAIVSVFRFIAYWIDSLIAWLVGILYNLILDIALVKFSFEAVAAVTGRIYVLLAIFMLFKVAFSLITYIASPDSMTDKNVGSTKLLRNIFISLLLIVAVPFIFEQARHVQGYILTEKVIQKIVFGGVGFADSENKKTIEDSGKRTAFMLYSTMIYPDTEKHSSLSACESVNEQTMSGCVTALNNIMPNAESDLVIGGLGDVYQKIYEDNLVQDLLSSKIIMAKYNGEYIFKYNGLISIAAGGVMIFVFMSLSIAVAIRLIKLTFLEVISPIPIMSYIDPKSGDKGMFQNWLKESVSTYLELFIRLAAVFFAVFAIVEFLGAGELEKIDGTEVGWFVKTIIIIGILIFVNNLPKLFEQLFPGFKSSGFSLNPLKQINESPLASNLVGRTLGAARGIGANAYSRAKPIFNRKNWSDTASNWREGSASDRAGMVFRGIGNVFSGAGSVVGGGASAAFRGKGKTVGEISKSGVASSIASRHKRADRASYNKGIDDQIKEIRSDQGLSDEQKNQLISGLEKERITLGRRFQQEIDRRAGVKNKEAGYGYIDSQTKSIERQISDLKQQEQGFRSAQTSLISDNFDKWNMEAFSEAVSLSTVVDNAGKRILNDDYDYYRNKLIEKSNNATTQEEKERIEASLLTEEVFKKYINQEISIKSINQQTAKLERELKRKKDISGGGKDNKPDKK